ncbi:hypothetical protein Pcinc_024183 [Petrolisthes cinctipes]|uniref:Uncharacterized protein n=1 Tax=Petrolisthes cinctipes TaxID=88211 RepID=A0AAE1FAF0_PETCI|nr:hypothetical protein Pcinc_024183 [Petrolisthes cinctipes]
MDIRVTDSVTERHARPTANMTRAASDTEYPIPLLCTPVTLPTHRQPPRHTDTTSPASLPDPPTPHHLPPRLTDSITDTSSPWSLPDPLTPHHHGASP